MVKGIVFSAWDMANAFNLSSDDSELERGWGKRVYKEAMQIYFGKSDLWTLNQLWLLQALINKMG